MRTILKWDPLVLGAENAQMLSGMNTRNFSPDTHREIIDFNFTIRLLKNTV